MQALIDFDGWRAWKSLPAPTKTPAKAKAAATAPSAATASTPSRSPTSTATAAATPAPGAAAPAQGAPVAPASALAHASALEDLHAKTESEDTIDTVSSVPTDETLGLESPEEIPALPQPLPPASSLPRAATFAAPSPPPQYAPHYATPPGPVTGRTSRANSLPRDMRPPVMDGGGGGGGGGGNGGGNRTPKRASPRSSLESVGPAAEDGRRWKRSSVGRSPYALGGVVEEG